MRVLGIDLAARAKKTYACTLDERDGGLVAELHARCEDEDLRGLAEGCAKVAIDAPFGWPNEFVDALVAHRARDTWPAPDDSEPDVFRASLSFRATDRVVMQTRRPLSVSTDKLGVTAMRCAHLLSRWSAEETVDRTGRGRFVEVYPAAALIRWGLAGSGYKRSAGRESLAGLAGKLLGELPELRLDARRTVESDDDAFDALVAALVARAAALGLTDAPPAALEHQAAQEGWIHLPVRGSLPFLTHAKGALRRKPAQALAQRMREEGVALDDAGYAPRLDDVLVPTLAADARAAVREQLTGKGGSELVPRGERQPKFHAAHSSAALAANAFGPFLVRDEPIPLGGERFRGEVALERECPSGLGGTPPTLDLVVEGEAILAVESKCTETFSSHRAHFSKAYADALSSADASWRAEFERLVEDPVRYRYLDAAQLVKHYLGLRTTFPGRAVVLAYLYWTPSNAEDLAPCRIHEAEVAEFDSRVRDPKLRFVAMPYRELWAGWSSKGPDWLKEHAAVLVRRYDVAV